MTRTFNITEAVREAVPLFIGLVGPSGSGKTGSALELAHGIQEVIPGDIGYLDTEANRALHYAKAPMFSDPKRTFKFKHLPFEAPFNPDSYKQALEALIKAGCKTVIIDSLSHEHEGQGGVLEMHEAQLDKLAGQDWDKRNKQTFLAWAKPKAERRALINFLLQQKVNVIACFRAKEKMRLVAGQKPVELGWQPIAGEEFVFEMTLNCLLLPGSNGVPTLIPEHQGERQMVKIPGQFRSIITEKRPLSAAVGRELATWAKGGSTQSAPPPLIQAKPAEAPSAPAAHPANELLDAVDMGADDAEPEFPLDGAPVKPASIRAMELTAKLQKAKTHEELLALKAEVLATEEPYRADVGKTFNTRNAEFKAKK